MFAGGKSNEDIWYSLLRPSFPNIKREEEIPVSWVNDYGITITGRPDMVICDDAGKPVHGLELKMVASVWTSRDVRFQGAPKLDHLCQAAHYMMLLEIPFSLCYAQYVEFPVVGWMQRNFPKIGTAGSEACEYNDKGEMETDVPEVADDDERSDSESSMNLRDHADTIPTEVFPAMDTEEPESLGTNTNALYTDWAGRSYDESYGIRVYDEFYGIYGHGDYYVEPHGTTTNSLSTDWAYDESYGHGLQHSCCNNSGEYYYENNPNFHTYVSAHDIYSRG
jgi:hypothetical protein